MNHVSEDHPQHHRRQHRDDQVDGKAARTGLRRQTHDNVEDLAAKLPDNRQNGAQLDNDVERHGAFAAEVQQVSHNNLVASA